jgi:hypothetical protein
LNWHLSSLCETVALEALRSVADTTALTFAVAIRSAFRILRSADRNSYASRDVIGGHKQVGLETLPCGGLHDSGHLRKWDLLPDRELDAVGGPEHAANLEVSEPISATPYGSTTF